MIDLIEDLGHGSVDGGQAANNPFHPAMRVMVRLPVASPMASRKNRIARDPKTNCKARLNLRVPMNMQDVNRPHMPR